MRCPRHPPVRFNDFCCNRGGSLVRLTVELLWSLEMHRLTNSQLGSAGIAGFANAIRLCAKLETLEYVSDRAYVGRRRTAGLGMAQPSPFVPPLPPRFPTTANLPGHPELA